MTCNPLNYGSREACQRLFDKGIVLETDAEWCQLSNGIGIYLRTQFKEGIFIVLAPAPSLAEVMREFSEDPNEMLAILQRRYGCDGTTFLFQRFFEIVKNIDEAIDLLIWTRDAAIEWMKVKG